MIDRCLQLINHRQKQNQELYTDFVTPAMSSLEELHKSYIESFNVYRELIQSTVEPMNLSHPIFEKIRKDILVSSELRAKVAALNSFDNDPTVGSFVHAITLYVLGQEQYTAAILNGYRPITNTGRIKIIEGLREIVQKEISDEAKRFASVETIDELINDRQGGYYVVRQEYEKLKAKLTIPILEPRN